MPGQRKSMRGSSKKFPAALLRSCWRVDASVLLGDIAAGSAGAGQTARPRPRPRPRPPAGMWGQVGKALGTGGITWALDMARVGRLRDWRQPQPRPQKRASKKLQADFCGRLQTNRHRCLPQCGRASQRGQATSIV